MPSLRLVKPADAPKGHEGDVLSCTYTPEGRFVLSAGWDGSLRLWDAETGGQVSEIKASPKPLSSCAVAPDGKRWWAGSMDGMLSQWDPLTHKQVSVFLAHTRPIAALVHNGDGSCLATASWDAQITLWKANKERDGRHLSGHRDIVAGCRFTPDGKLLASWSYDGTVRLWDLAWSKELTVLKGHTDRVTAGAVCPDGRCLASGSRDRTVRLWELPSGQPLHSITVPAEVRACFFLLDAQSLVVADSNGRLALYSVPELTIQSELATRLPVQCADLAPSGGQMVLGGADGFLRFVAVDGFDQSPLLTTLTQTSREEPGNVLQRLLGKKRVRQAFQCTCPACRHSFEVPGPHPNMPAPCPQCHRHLRISSPIRIAEPALG